tara:strand:- start:27118 stop:27459 length:342 start_codon:yes stop_codon:yes gene_type:complete
MKIYLLILLCLFLSCKNKKEHVPQKILTTKNFVIILKDIHLEEAKFELQKKVMKITKAKLKNSYDLIYKKHQISEEIFKKTLTFYAQNPEKLERIYSKVLEQLTNDQSKLDQQ